MIAVNQTALEAITTLVAEGAASSRDQAAIALDLASDNDDGVYEYSYNGRAVGITSSWSEPFWRYTVFIWTHTP